MVDNPQVLGNFMLAIDNCDITGDSGFLCAPGWSDAHNPMCVGLQGVRYLKMWELFSGKGNSCPITMTEKSPNVCAVAPGVPHMCIVAHN